MTAAKSAVPPRIKIPDVGGLSLKQAALTYAQAGMHIVPTRVGATKNPGSLVGAGWHNQASNDPEQIEKWWSEYPRIGGIAFHPGPSGVVVFDYDKTMVSMPDNVREALETGKFQQSRENGIRGHRFFACAPGEFGGSAGAFMRWGEVRSQGGVIILAPSAHPEDDGLYRWHETGELPPLPDLLRDMLSAPGESVEPKTSDELKVFLAKYTENNEPHGLQGPLGKFQTDTKEGGSRHDAMKNALPWAFRESIIGRFPARFAYDGLKHAFFRVKPEAMPTGEFDRLAQWAAAQAELADPDEIRARVDRPKTESVELGDFEHAVEYEVRKIEVREEAKRRISAKGHVPFARTPLDLANFLDQPPNPTPMRIDSLMPDGGRVVFSAPYKAGKTTAVGNLIRSLVDGDPFLGTFAVNKTAKRLVLIDNELSADMVRDWLLKQGIKNRRAVADVICLRGEVSMFDILDDRRRGEWVAYLREIGCDYLVLDCLRPVLDALGLDENHDAGRFLTAFDALLSDAQIDGNATIVHHMGHTGERSRGDSRIQDWPDAIWKLVRSDSKDDLSPRLFSATGRDVEVAEGTLEYNAATRHLTYRDGNRSQARQSRRADTAITEIVKMLTDAKRNGEIGISQNKLIEQVRQITGIGEPTVKSALDLGEKEGSIVWIPGVNKQKIYSIAAETDKENG